MNYIKRLPALLLLLLATGCAGSEEKTTTTPVTTTPPATTPIQPVQQPATAPAVNTVALNPAHGMPGHRCDLKVGAPLNSAPAPAVTTAPQQAPIINPPATNTANGPKNPAHGMPGHRCDIAVGAPLNSRPAQ